MWEMMLEVLLWDIWWLWATKPSKQCTRCGGDHSLSQCTWPAARPESKVE